MTNIQKRLFAMQDKAYGDFNSRLIPTVERERVIGVRAPNIRKLAKELSGTPEALAFMAALPHEYFEENGLHGALIENIRDFDEAVAALDAFLPHVDNWATCDMIKPRAFTKRPAGLPEVIRRWIGSTEPYTVRFGIGMLMAYYLDGDFSPAYPALVAGVRREEYYVNMMIAWYFATALAKQYDSVIGYLRENRLELWTHNKTIQKAVESRRLTAEQKAYLRSLKRKAE